jgi:hypothetical protein
LPGELMCSEWMRANGYAPEHLPPPRQAFQLEVQPPSVESKPAAPVTVDVHDARVALPAIPADDIAAFKAAGVEVQLAIGEGTIYLIPEYTPQNRIELSIEHAATLRRLLDAFPGARIAKLSRVPSAKETGHG